MNALIVRGELPLFYFLFLLLMNIMAFIIIKYGKIFIYIDWHLCSFFRIILFGSYANEVLFF